MSWCKQAGEGAGGRLLAGGRETVKTAAEMRETQLRPESVTGGRKKEDDGRCDVLFTSARPGRECREWR